MRVAVYGGSFNPPHVAHAMVASWLLWTGQAEEVWLVPVYRHAFEALQSKRLADFALRHRWCEAMAEDIGPCVRVSRIEAELPVPSFTRETLDALSLRHPEHSFRLVVGADVLDEVHLWRDWAGIVARYAPITVGRAGHPRPPGYEGVDFPEVSSTELRARHAEGRPLDHLLTARVAALLGDTSPWERA